ncbi:MAG: 30S ribosomal protein S2 [Bacteroidota bacterium]|nr:30S ribosomal protein S2 [Candidatus Kapabacteria bacterium]MCS7302667.1 30S ribosomal protein S2 [Candidatus Kapabacteria bacterium]MCX7936175.1 30S ribosomal protein S2 [Chlorobiota bacterium]MDW8074931.1 30S ribosomal protein S2 [Bacteroidota bacterium]MDW8271570.1 30S ribosomal protein S2 [Bacteroidota bacterium]
MVTIEQLLEAGAHFGHLRRRWNPKMRPFIYGEREGIHIIDLRKTVVLLDLARQAALDIASEGKIILFVGTKPQAKDIIKAAAQRCGMPYVVERWLGGMLTNFSTIRRSIKRLATIDKMEADGTFEKLTKKERLLLSRERDRLRLVFGGIEEMVRLPGALFVVDIKKEDIAVKEARILDIPVIGIVDTNSDPEQVEYPIPANDDSIKTIELIANLIADAVIEGKQIARTRAADLAAVGEREAKETPASTGEYKARPRLRQRRRPSASRPQEAETSGDGEETSEAE